LVLFSPHLRQTLSYGQNFAESGTETDKEQNDLDDDAIRSFVAGTFPKRN
jgi:hypothetical protein